MNNLPPCDPNIIKNGVQLCMIVGSNTEQIEAWVTKARDILVKSSLDQDPGIDWHFYAGRAIVHTTCHPSFAISALLEAGLPQVRWYVPEGNAVDLGGLTDEQRLAIFNQYCKNCGGKRLPCNCTKGI